MKNMYYRTDAKINLRSVIRSKVSPQHYKKKATFPQLNVLHYQMQPIT